MRWEAMRYDFLLGVEIKVIELAESIGIEW